MLFPSELPRWDPRNPGQFITWDEFWLHMTSEDKDIEYVDLRFTDPRGKLQHVTIFASMVTCCDLPILEVNYNT